ncbi:hypothetical protein F2P81_012135 [Scophthalmus maximus]|uniref:Uncharacterized protein n=1 Tax=Scophthalmus maximus TaxID=52904 RepID=A0A6A4SMF5_SCOMX|nr:hypothetical protein F2P81_012135 [Scophthalmus maximus]
MDMQKKNTNVRRNRCDEFRWKLKISTGGSNKKGSDRGGGGDGGELARQNWMIDNLVRTQHGGGRGLIHYRIVTVSAEQKKKINALKETPCVFSVVTISTLIPESFHVSLQVHVNDKDNSDTIPSTFAVQSHTHHRKPRVASVLHIASVGYNTTAYNHQLYSTSGLMDFSSIRTLCMICIILCATSDFPPDNKCYCVCVKSSRIPDERLRQQFTAVRSLARSPPPDSLLFSPIVQVNILIVVRLNDIHIQLARLRIDE